MSCCIVLPNNAAVIVEDLPVRDGLGSSMTSRFIQAESYPNQYFASSNACLSVAFWFHHWLRLMMHTFRRKQNSLGQLISLTLIQSSILTLACPLACPFYNRYIGWHIYNKEWCAVCWDTSYFSFLIRAVGNLHYSSTSGCLYLVQKLLFTSCIKSWPPCAVFCDSLLTHFWTTQLTGTQYKEIWILYKLFYFWNTLNLRDITIWPSLKLLKSFFFFLIEGFNITE